MASQPRGQRGWRFGKFFKIITMFLQNVGASLRAACDFVDPVASGVIGRGAQCTSFVDALYNLMTCPSPVVRNSTDVELVPRKRARPVSMLRCCALA